MAAREFKVIAATGTISGAETFMQALTGLAFEVVDESDNGAPSHGLTVMHIEGPDYGAAAETTASEMLSALTTEMPKDMAFLAFADTRQGCERITRAIGNERVMPYRSGYTLAERQDVEGALRRKELEGVTATSSLEVGVHIPQFTIGLNVSVPQTRKALRQRAGRIGRDRPGIFAVMAPSSAFAQLGTSFREYFLGPVEPTPLYLENGHIQFQQACCLREEINADDETWRNPDLAWPPGFSDMVAYAQPGAVRPGDLDMLANLGFEAPQLAFPLRRISEINFALKNARTGDVIGTIEHEKAQRETYPGAIYYHKKRPHRVVEWRSSSYDHAILLEPLKNAQPTKPILRTQVSISFEAGELIDNNLLVSEVGALAEIRLRVAESVEGYRVGTTPILYKDLPDRRLKRKQREFSTTGIALRVVLPWFSGSAEHVVATRKAVANGLATILARECGISPGDLRTAHTGIAIYERAGARKIDDAVVIFDNVAGGLRLCGPLFRRIAEFLRRLERAANMAGADALIGATTIERLLDWHSGLASPVGEPRVLLPNVGEDVVVFAPMSEVNVRIRGQLVQRRLLEPQLVKLGGNEELMYRYEAGPGVEGWVMHDQVEAVGHDWHRALWNPRTKEIRELDA